MSIIPIPEGSKATYYGSLDTYHGEHYRVFQCTDELCNEAWSAGIERYELVDIFDEPRLKHVRRESLGDIA